MFAREAKVQGLKSRAAFKLLELDSKHRIFSPGQTVVDLGYAPGSWSQVAVERTKPWGMVVGIDLIPAQPPKGVSTIQGNVLSPAVQLMAKEFLANHDKHQALAGQRHQDTESQRRHLGAANENEVDSHQDASLELVQEGPGYIERERTSSTLSSIATRDAADGGRSYSDRPLVVLSDMSAPWDQTTGFGVNTLSNPYDRLMNTSGISLRDHSGSMDLCHAALHFASETLKPGGHFICKFYQGAEDKDLELQLRNLFAKVHREKPESSRKDSKEAYFVALRRRKDVRLHDDARNHESQRR